jgi:proline dehydrogenase
VLPGVEYRAYRLALRFVAGRERNDAIALSHQLADDGLACSVDFFGGSVSDSSEAERVADAYVQLVGALLSAPPGASCRSISRT